MITTHLLNNNGEEPLVTKHHMINTLLTILAVGAIAFPIGTVKAKAASPFPGKNGNKQSPVTADSAPRSAQLLGGVRQSVRFTANATIRAKHTNTPDQSSAMSSEPKQFARAEESPNRGSGQRALLRSLQNLSVMPNPASGSGQSSDAARQSVRYAAVDLNRAMYANALDHSVAFYPSPGQTSGGDVSVTRGSGQRAYLRSLRNDAELDY